MSVNNDQVNAAIDSLNTELKEPMVELDGKQVALADALDTLRERVRTEGRVEEQVYDVTKPRVIEPVPLEVGGKVHMMRLPFWACKKFEEVAGFSIWDHEKTWSYPYNLETIVTLIWAACLHENKDLTREEVVMWDGMEFGNIHYIRHMLNMMWGRNQPEPEPTNGSVPNPIRPALTPPG